MSDATNPESGTLVYDSDIISDELTGYHTIKLEDKVKLLHSTNASVVITQFSGGTDVIMMEMD